MKGILIIKILKILKFIAALVVRPNSVQEQWFKKVNNFLSKNHTHPNNPQCAEVLKLKSMMLKECRENPCINNKEIFDNICRTNPDAAAYISYNNMKSIMFREKVKSRPPLPKTVQSAHEMLENYNVLKDIYKGCAISNESKYALIFSNIVLLSALENANEIYMDGTFSVVPQMPVFHQLYTVHIRYTDTVYHY
nr:PREDICTED: uncharacterized protein LOC105662845 [Megachile rotundata]XP_012144580.1 PREDICTED: uncharacterized protein LOC105662963 [Megachile rotundata]